MVSHPCAPGERTNADPSTHHPQTDKRLGTLSLRKTRYGWRFEVSHPKRRNKDALRMGHPRVAVSLHRRTKSKNKHGSFDFVRADVA